MSIEYPCIYYENMGCKKFSVDGNKSWCLLGPCGDQVLSNADRIRNLSDEELADFFDGVQREECATLHEVKPDGTFRFESLRNGWLLWLQQPAEEVHYEE